jgi:hypothetical protein
MLAFDPQYRTKGDTEDFGDRWFINLEEIDDVVEYVLQISGRPVDGAKAARGNVLFHDGAKGNCYDCHGEDGAGIETFGSTNLTRPDLYLYDADRDSIRESIIKGRHGSMPLFRGRAQARRAQGGLGLRLLARGAAPVAVRVCRERQFGWPEMLFSEAAWSRSSSPLDEIVQNAISTFEGIPWSTGLGIVNMIRQGSG